MSKYRERLSSKRMGLLLLACIFIAGLGYAPQASAVVRASAVDDSYAGDFEFLSQYGEWMGLPPYGVVWRPYADEDWAPFSDGSWIWTSDGWAWNSYEPFGDLVYHYGYWYYDRDFGWFWVPGDEWSPARVEWYTTGTYCGWAPLPPPSFYWPDPWDTYYDIDIWIVVNVGNFYDDHIGHHAIDLPRIREALLRGIVDRRPPNIQQVKRLARRDIPVQTIEKHPARIGSKQLKTAERLAAQRTDAGTRAPARTQQRTIAPRQNAQIQRVVTPQQQDGGTQRNVVTPRQPAQPQRDATAPRQQPQRGTAEPRQPAQPQREAAESRQPAQPQREAAPQRTPETQRAAPAPPPAQVDRRAEAPSRSAPPPPPPPSRAAERGSDRNDSAKGRR
jgi:hypothetical protein